MILPDNETKVDLLNNQAIAATIIKLLSDRRDQPVTIGVHGDWGAGKSSVLEMIEAGLEAQSDVLCLKFNGWRFQGFEDAKIALIEGIATGLIEKRPVLTKATEEAKALFRRIDWLKVAKKLGGLAFTAYTGIPSPELVQAALGKLDAIWADPTTLATKENLAVVLDSLKGYAAPASESKNVPEEIQAFRKAFDGLLKKAGIGQLVVLIDDLDRCLPDTAIETLEAVRLFVFTSRTAFVVAADEAMIEYAVRKHFPDLPDTTGPRDYARNYLEKLIQIPFRIPPLGETETRIYVTLLLIGADIGEDAAEYTALIDIARKLLNRPWESAPLDAASLKGALKEKAPGAQNALTLSDQIGPILAAGSQGNPRQIKRFLNSLLLRHRTAEARGYGSEINLPILAKLMLAERFLPRLFEQVARLAANDPKGICEDLAALEAAEEDGTKPREKTSKGKGTDKDLAARPDTTAGGSESVARSEWLSSPPIREWARVQPPLAAVDLRPYLFIAKDRKDHFGATSALGRLASVVGRLLGAKLTVQAMESELKQLASAEAAQVFEALRSRIMAGAAFDTEPNGIPGLAVLVKAHPAFQANLLDLLEAIPRDRCGAWAVSGWEGVITDPNASTRLDRLLENWSTLANNPILKAAAAATLKTRRASR